MIDRTEVEAGSDFGVGGNGFPPSAPVAILFGDDPASRLDIVTDANGIFLATVPTRASERGGDRTVVAQAADGTTAWAPLEVIAQSEMMTGVPGFGLG
jgi:hypothetical protein